jgi:hypothetical protein
VAALIANAPATVAVEPKAAGVVGGVFEVLRPPLAANNSNICCAPPTEHSESRGVPPSPHYVPTAYNCLPVDIDAVW